MKLYKNSNGFIAITSVIIIFSTLFVFSMIAFWIVWNKFDQQILELERIQVGHNLNSCLSFAKVMITKDYLINGKIYLKPFACELFFENNFSKIKINATSTFDRLKKNDYIIIEIAT
jgi:hypothetical protein